MRGPLLPRAPLGALVLPLLLLLVATSGTQARPHAADASEAEGGDAAVPASGQSFFAPGAWRPVLRTHTDDTGSSSSSFGARSAPHAGAPLVDRVASRVRVEDTNRSGRVDVKPPSSASTAAGTSTEATKRATPALASTNPAADAAATATTTAATPDADTATAAAPAATTISITTTTAAASAAKAAAAASPNLGASIHRVTSQLLTTAEDVRTPPKLRHQQEHRGGQGVAVPVILEEDELERAEEVLTRRSSASSTSKPPEEGLSTWVLLSGSNGASSTTASGSASTSSTASPPSTTTTTPAAVASASSSTSRPKPKPTARPPVATKRPAPPAPRPSTAAPPPKRTPHPPPATAASRKPGFASPALKTTTLAASTATTTTAPPSSSTTPRAKPLQQNASKKNASTYDAPLAPAMTRKPPTTVSRTTAAPSTTTKLAVAPATTSTTTEKVDVVDEDETATVVAIVTESTEIDSDVSEEPETKTETSTRRTRRPGSNGGKKKKNKNKRRKNRPSAANGTAVAESKIGESDSNSTKPAQSKDRPLSTRIYNYLAREVMPSFGVGLLGLAITAGLAGLIMYPFGGGAAKRTYEVDAPVLPNHGNFYYYGGEYDGEDHGQAEESVIRKVFEGMSSSENEQPEDGSSFNNQRYPAESDAAVGAGTVTTYAGDVQNNRYASSQSGPGMRGTQPGYNAGATDFYNVEQANKYYSSNPAPRPSFPGTAPHPKPPSGDAANLTDTSNDGGRVRYREVATGSVAEPSAPNPQQITKKSDYYGYNAGRVRYRDVGTGEVSADMHGEAPRVRFREVGSDTVHYSLSDQTSNEGGVEHGPRNVRVKRQTIDMLDVGRKIGDLHSEMANAHRKMAAEVAEFADHAKKVSDKSAELGNEIDLLLAKKNKPKKAMGAGKPMKIKKGEVDDDGEKLATKSEMDEDEDEDEEGMGTSMIDSESYIDDSTHDIVDVELVTGVPDHTSMEVLGEQVEYDSMTDEYPSEMPAYVMPVTYSSTERVPDTYSSTERVPDTYSSTERVPDTYSTTERVPDTTTTGAVYQPTNVPELVTDAASSTASVPEETRPQFPTSAPKPPPQSSIVDLLKQIAQLKIRLGLDFLKSTSQAFSTYLDSLQKNMEDALKQGRTAQYRRTNFWNYRRSKRDAKKTLNLKKKKSKSD